MTTAELNKLLGKEETTSQTIEAITANGNKLFSIRGDKKSLFINLTGNGHKILKAINDPVEAWKFIFEKVSTIQLQEQEQVSIDDIENI